jgi:type VI secretion system protein ImpM
MKQNNIGIFGKLPAHGDFIQRNLTAGFINTWDEWQQHFVAGTKEQLGENWLDVYLTSPLWRFVFSDGVIDENSWAGIMIPSVDRVGRYYPFSIVTKLPQNTNPFEFINLQNAWYKELEGFALGALDGEVLIDDLMTSLNLLTIEHQSDYSRSSINSDTNSFQFDMKFEEQSATSVYPLLLDVAMTKLVQSYSVWKTTGSDYVMPCLFSTQGLPGIQQMPAMLSGDWKNFRWAQPYVLKETQGIGEAV